MRQASHSVCTGIFIISGLGLRRGEAMRALSAWGAILFGFASILFITPLAAVIVQRLPLTSPELTLGLAVFCLHAHHAVQRRLPHPGDTHLCS